MRGTLLSGWTAFGCMLAANSATAQCANTWAAATPGANGGVDELVELQNGDLVGGGRFAVGGTGLDGVGVWTGTAWSSLGANMDSSVRSLVVLPNGDLIAAGYFTVAGGASANRVARWDGSSWSSLGTGMDGPVRDLVAMPNGDLIAWGEFTTAGGAPAYSMARWDGAAWSSFPDPFLTRRNQLLALPNGDLLAAGASTVLLGPATYVDFCRVYRYSSSTGWWSQLGVGQDFYGEWKAVAVLPNGNVVAGGPGVAEWNGTTWSFLSPGLSVESLTVLPDGDLVAAGLFASVGGVVTDNIARWDGASWSGFGSGVNHGMSSQVWAMMFRRGGDLAVASTAYAGSQSAYVDVLRTTCPAAAVAYGSACVGPTGQLTLQADTLPWLGAEFRASASAFAANSFALRLLGVQTVSAPVSTFHPAGVAGCDVLTSIDVGELMVPAAGSLQFGLAVPQTLALVGLVANVQVALVQLDAQLAITAVTTSNALRLTIGAF